MSGRPITLFNSNVDTDRNGILIDPLPAGSYSGVGVGALTVDNKGGRNGAIGPDYVQADLRLGYRRPLVGRGFSRAGDQPGNPEGSPYKLISQRALRIKALANFGLRHGADPCGPGRAR